MEDWLQVHLKVQSKYGILDSFKCTDTITGHYACIYSLIQLQDGRLASGSRDKTIKIWNPHDNFECTQTLKGHTHFIYNLIQLHDGRLASGSADRTIRIWKRW